MTEEEKLKRGAELHAAMKAARERRLKMTPEELAIFMASEDEGDGALAAPLEDQERLGR